MMIDEYSKSSIHQSLSQTTDNEVFSDIFYGTSYFRLL